MLTIDDYKPFLERWTYDGQAYTPEYMAVAKLRCEPLSRYYTMRFAFEWFRANGHRTIVELGTLRSYRHSGPGCNEPQDTWWNPKDPKGWDWGSGMFSRLAAICLGDMKPEIHTVDIKAEHMRRARVMTYDYEKLFTYHIISSVDFLKTFGGPIDLLYLDTGDMTPLEPTAALQQEEALEIVKRELLSKRGIILIDDVRNTTPFKFGDRSGLGKSKYSIPFLKRNGYVELMNEYQVVMRR